MVSIINLYCWEIKTSIIIIIIIYAGITCSEVRLVAGLDVTAACSLSKERCLSLDIVQHF